VKLETVLFLLAVTCGTFLEMESLKCYGGGGPGSETVFTGSALGYGPSDFPASHLVAGNDHTCFLSRLRSETSFDKLNREEQKNYDKIFCWGSNYFGQLGIASTQLSSSPLAVSFPSEAGNDVRITSIAAGGGHTCALLENGSAYCWGRNNDGQLGDGTQENKDKPTLVQAPEGVSFVSIVAGGYHTCGATTKGDIYCWGSNISGQLGIADILGSKIPTRVKRRSNIQIRSINAGEVHTCVFLRNGNVICWGGNNHGQLGLGHHLLKADPSKDFTPVTMPPNISLQSIFTRFQFNCGLTLEGAAYCWGRHGYRHHDKNSNSPIYSSQPGLVPAQTPFKSISIGKGFVCGLSAQGYLYCWGLNRFGIPGGLPGTLPVLSPDSSDSVVPIVFDAIASGSDHACGATQDESIYCWGNNKDGQLGDNSNKNYSIPVQVPLNR